MISRVGASTRVSFSHFFIPGIENDYQGVVLLTLKIIAGGVVVMLRKSLLNIRNLL